ncbi:hypothetical protein M514_26338 [Trichuris suis]|uniref:Uncharacterized protein n=1 Tax=Trichuris suis TaxID=68888 RepID=A0A085MWC6_9BILA|nr:hypothetical protein M513_12475 [Trichuris suis]KFD61522.1 hypothetical protein M514_12475 [Trichuris suis]KFD61525.1 hypothetical protein M514_26338 [Trichuris suis]
MKALARRGRGLNARRQATLPSYFHAWFKESRLEYMIAVFFIYWWSHDLPSSKLRVQSKLSQRANVSKALWECLTDSRGVKPLHERTCGGFTRKEPSGDTR